MSQGNGKHAGGRPRKIKDAQELEAKIVAYFQQGEGDPLFCPTITGLVLFCGYVDRISFYAMEKRPEFRNTIKKARALIEAVYERRLHSSQPTGAIFALKNFGWRDTPEPSKALSGQKVVIVVNASGESKELLFADLFRNGHAAPQPA